MKSKEDLLHKNLGGVFEKKKNQGLLPSWSGKNFAQNDPFDKLKYECEQVEGGEFEQTQKHQNKNPGFVVSALNLNGISQKGQKPQASKSTRRMTGSQCFVSNSGDINMAGLAKTHRGHK